MQREHEVRLNSRAATPVDPEQISQVGTGDQRHGDLFNKKRRLSPSPARSDASVASIMSMNVIDAKFQRCDGCNKRHEGGRLACRMKLHVDFNKVGLFKDSSVKKRIDLYNRSNPIKKLYTLQWHHRFSSRGTLEPYTMPQAVKKN